MHVGRCRRTYDGIFPDRYSMKLFRLTFSAFLAAAGFDESLARPPEFTSRDLAQLAKAYEISVRDGRFASEHEERQVNYFVGYVEGAALASRSVCLPSRRGVRDQISAATAKYIREHPGQLNMAPDALVVKAVQPLFPCATTPNRKR